jgi:hypothetical protein
MKPTRGNNSPACHSTFATTRRAHAHDLPIGAVSEKGELPTDAVRSPRYSLPLLHGKSMSNLFSPGLTV